MSNCLKRAFFLFTTAIILLNPPISQAQSPWVLAVHIGSQSLDRHDNTELEIRGMVRAVCRYMPSATHITIATYLDYPEQISMWLEEIHDCNKSAWVRSGGFNYWQQTNGETEIGTPEQYVADLEEWILDNCEMFEDGDRFEPTPDEPSNGTYWQERFQAEGASDVVVDEFNVFVQNSYIVARDAFDRCDKQGVIVDGVHDNPSVVKDIISSETAMLLPLLGTDNYPRQEQAEYTPGNMGVALKSELEDWVHGVHEPTPKCVTLGPSPYHELAPGTQSLSTFIELLATTITLPDVRCITVWQVGDISNWPNNRLLENIGSERHHIWRPRPAAKIVNAFFGYLLKNE